MQRLLIIDDDIRLATMVGDYLQSAGYVTTHAATGEQGLQRLSEGVDLVLLDLMLPDVDGLQLCRRIRGRHDSYAHTPILMLTAKGDPLERVIGLELGADDYLPKPFEPRELLARVRAVLRRQGTQSSAQVMRFGCLEIDRSARRIAVNGEVRSLSASQFDLLVAFAERAGRVLSREQLLDLANGSSRADAGEAGFDRSIDVQVARIRAAIEDDVRHPRRVITVRGAGYVFAREQD